MSASSTEIRFAREVYSGEAVDEAVKTFANFASFELTEDEAAWIVRVTPKSPDVARRLIGEFGNYALGLTIQRGGTTTV